MSHRFTVVHVAGIPRAVFEGNNEKAWVLGCFLSEATSFLSGLLDTVESAATADTYPVQFSGNEVFLDLYPDRAVIAAQWIKDEAGNECEVTLPLEEAKQLLIEWGKVLQHYPPKS